VTSALTKEQRSKVSGGWWSYAAEVLRPAITNQRGGRMFGSRWYVVIPGAFMAFASSN